MMNSVYFIKDINPAHQFSAICGTLDGYAALLNQLKRGAMYYSGNEYA